MKKIIIIFVMLLGITTLFCQLQADGIFELKIDRQDMPFRLKPVSSFDRNGEIWRPLSSYLYLVSSEQPTEENSYRYDTTGVLQQEEIIYLEMNPSLIARFGIYNQTFIHKRYDFPDTLTRYYVQPGTNYIPRNREYYDYHFYDRYPQDSFYYYKYIDVWNDITQKWDKQRREYLSYFDTTVFVIREVRYDSFIDEEWVMTDGYRVLREYDEEGLVASMILQECNLQTGEYKIWNKHLFFYDEDNIHIETHVYYPDADGWKLESKDTDIEYAEWYSNSQPGIRFDESGSLEWLVLADKRAKMKSYIRWKWNENDEWEKWLMSKHEWDLHETKSHIDTMYTCYDDIWYLRNFTGHLYDEQENYIQRWLEVFNPPNTLDIGEKDCILINYHPQYGGIESAYWYALRYKPATQLWDSTYYNHYEYFDWWDVTKVSIAESEPSGTASLSIFPNPVSGMVIISAESEIEQLSIFDITGRLVANLSPTGERVVFDTGILPQGVYLVRALLRDGEVRTGKVVVR